MHTRRTRHTPRRAQRGLTLIELLIGTMIAAFLTAAAFAFAAHESRLMGVSRERVELGQASRSAIDLIADDIAQAGSGVGYFSSNPLMNEPMVATCGPGNRCFGGLLTGQFTVRGNAFNTNAIRNQTGGAVTAGIRLQSLPIETVGQRGGPGTAYAAFTQDFAVRFANGSYATVASYGAGGGEFCLPQIGTVATQYRTPELALLRHQDGVFAQSVLISATPACANAACRFGCNSFLINPDPENTYASDDNADIASYLGGELQGGLQTVVWFVRPVVLGNNVTTGRLFRAVHDAQSCVGAVANLANCAGAVADYAEGVHIRLWEWDAAGLPPAWVFRPQTPVNTQNRIRVDIELILRSRVADTRTHAQSPLQLLDNTCVPSLAPGCDATQDGGDRRVYRTTIEVLNSGRMAFSP